MRYRGGETGHAALLRPAADTQANYNPRPSGQRPAPRRGPGHADAETPGPSSTRLSQLPPRQGREVRLCALRNKHLTEAEDRADAANISKAR